MLPTFIPGNAIFKSKTHKRRKESLFPCCFYICSETLRSYGACKGFSSGSAGRAAERESPALWRWCAVSLGEEALRGQPLPSLHLSWVGFNTRRTLLLPSPTSSSRARSTRQTHGQPPVLVSWGCHRPVDTAAPSSSGWCRLCGVRAQHAAVCARPDPPRHRSYCQGASRWLSHPSAPCRATFQHHLTSVELLQGEIGQ